MGKIRLLQIGLGNFGKIWFETVLPFCDKIEVVGVVTGNPAKADWAAHVAGLARGQVYANLEQALDETQPDLLLNVTPPAAHLQSTLPALRRGIAVLCEKPIADTQRDAVEMVKAASQYNTPVMIAENYRFFDIMRRAKTLLDEGAVGRIHMIGFDFYRAHKIRNYHTEMDHPLLMDISPHHFDTFRYLTGCEAVRLRADAWDPEWSVYRRNSCVEAHIEMEKDIHICYRAALAAFRDETGWLGNWHIEGDRGVLAIDGDNIVVTTASGTAVHHCPLHEESLLRQLDEAASALAGGKKSENDITENIKSYNMVLAAIRACETGETVRMAAGACLV